MQAKLTLDGFQFGVAQIAAAAAPVTPFGLEDFSHFGSSRLSINNNLIRSSRLGILGFMRPAVNNITPYNHIRHQMKGTRVWKPSQLGYACKL